MQNQYSTEEQVKLDWSTPNLEVLNINENTLGGGGIVTDGVLLS